MPAADMAPLNALLTTAVTRSLRSTVERQPALTGFALCTDSSVRTLFSIATDVPATHWRWPTPNEWQLAPVHADELREFSKQLATAADRAREIETHAKTAWAILEHALSQARGVTPNVLLLVADTDPEPLTRGLMTESARRLNSERMFTTWERALTVPNEELLKELRSKGLKL